MTYSIRKATVIGAGTMGAGIAAHLANVGIHVYLLDIVPTELTQKEKSRGQDFNHPAVRNRFASEGLARVVANSRSGLYFSKLAVRVTIGNLEDNFAWIGRSDWVIEAVVEDLAVKQNLMRQIDEIREPKTIVTTNTSGIPIKDIVRGSSDSLIRHFLGTHFFNPPRNMNLLEIIPGSQTDPEVLDFVIKFCEEALGKGVVICKDTPNFIANRIAAIQRSFDMEYVLAEGYTVEETDAVLGPPLGRPKTALFRLGDLVGIDVSTKVGQNLYELIPQDDFRDLLLGERSRILRTQMIEAEMLGRKSGSGFYKQVKTPEGMQFWGLDLETLEYREPIIPQIPRLEQAYAIQDLAERIRFLISDDDRLGRLVWASLRNVFQYAAYTIPEISDSLLAVDRAMRWGYSWELGPFELWDALGVEEVVQRITTEGHTVAEWVNGMIAAGVESLYKVENGQRYQYSPSEADYIVIPGDPRILLPTTMRGKSGIGTEIGPAIRLLDLEDGVAYLQVDAKASENDRGIFGVINTALERVDHDFEGLVISIIDNLTSAGVSIDQLAKWISDQRFDAINESLERMMALHRALRSFTKPIVFASTGHSTGANSLLAMSTTHVCASAESNFGYQEVAFGLLPASGSCKELLRRLFFPLKQFSGLDPLPILRHIFDLIAYAKVSGSAVEAREFGFLTESDDVVMNQDHVLRRAKNKVMARIAEGLKSSAVDRSIYVLGERGKSALGVSIYLLHEAGYAPLHDQLIAQKLAHILSGGNLTTPQWIDENHIMELEQEAFLSLCGEEKTLARIEHFIKTGKRLRN
jgi:3-hydroxyacyl-CoA dehydrogenase